MKQMLLVLVFGLGLVGCNAKMRSVERHDRIVQVPVIVTPPVTSEVDRILAEENAYRLGLGQTMLSSGLSCVLYTITGGDRIQSSIAGHNTLTGLSTAATFLLSTQINQPNGPVSDGMGLLPTFLRSLYQNLYLLRCQGQLVVTSTGYVQFNLQSDDASVLYIGGTKVVDNDNAHSVTSVSGSKYLRKGVYAFRLDYAQTAGGNQALILKANGDVIDPMYLVH